MMQPGQAKARQEVRRVTAPAIEAYTETRITVCERAMRIVRGGTGEPVVFSSSYPDDFRHALDVIAAES